MAPGSRAAGGARLRPPTAALATAHAIRGLPLIGLAGVLASMAGCASLAPPLKEPEVAGYAMRLAEAVSVEAPPIVGRLTAAAAVERALRLNYDLRASTIEAELAEQRAQVEAGGMLPDVLAQSERYRRNKPHLSRSSQSFSYSGSSDLATLSNTIALSWNVLDFGLSYIRSRQTENEAGKKWEEAGIVAGRVIEDTRLSYWQAVALHTLTPRLVALDAEVGRAMAMSRRAEADRLLNPRDSISFQRDTLNLRREINDLHSQIAGADERLKSLIAAPPGSKLALDGKRRLDGLPLPRASMGEDVMLALTQRPEIRQHIYDLRITSDEVHAAVLRVLPNLSLTEAFNTDSNSFLLSNNWVSWTSKLAFHLIELVRLPARLESIETQQDVNRARMLAAAASIAMQVHVARARIAVELRAYRDAEEFAKAQKQLLSQTVGAFKAGRIGEQVLAQDNAAALLAEIRAILAFGELHAALAAYEVSLGAQVTAFEMVAATP